MARRDLEKLLDLRLLFLPFCCINQLDGCVVGNFNPTYQREVDVFGVDIDKLVLSSFFPTLKTLGIQM
ncbi:hypothetical protein RDI58_009156 [Solanum bulbocastanum]|uniref:Uncharacterized protein n=1 Tax=Solanum bulbocastanum TaxID=147425 RepID=A0AAN8YKS5_SOLBU